MKVKKGLWVIAGVLVLLIVALFYFRDSRDMEKVSEEQLQNAKDSADSKFDQLNEDFDIDDSDVEEAGLAYDTLSSK